MAASTIAKRVVGIKIRERPRRKIEANKSYKIGSNSSSIAMIIVSRFAFILKSSSIK